MLPAIGQDAAIPARRSVLCVVGLGNPGPRYAWTRHNIGFRVVDKLADILRIREFFVEGNRSEATGHYGEWDVILCKPATYMNRSGEAVIGAMQRFDLRDEDLLVIHDEVQLPLGHLRLRVRGSDGGHNGLASILEATGTDRIPRLRCGIDFSSASDDLATFVLSPFEEEELPHVVSMIDRAAQAVLAIMESGMQRAMNAYNTPPTTHRDSI